MKREGAECVVNGEGDIPACCSELGEGAEKQNGGGEETHVDELEG